MNRPIRKLTSLMISALLGVSAVYLPTAGAATDPLHEDVSMAPGRNVTPQEEAILSRAAARVLQHIGAARAAIHDHKPDRATAELAKAKDLIEIIKAARPTTQVTDHIWVDKKHLDYKNTHQVAVDLIPIEAALTDIEDLVPVEKLRQHVKAMQKGKKPSAAKGLDVLQDALLYTEVDLPLAATEQQVIAAREALVDKDTKRADRALATAQEGVQFISVAIEAPMAAARDSLGQATKDFAAKKYDLVKQDLAAAKAQLNRAVKGGDELTRREAARIQKAIGNIEGKVSAGGKETANAIEGMWDRTVALAEREVEKASMGWAKHRSTTTARAALIEAKQHIAFAENLEFYAQSDPQDIFKALDDALRDLQQAKADAHLGQADQDEIDRVAGAIDGIRKDLQHRAAYTGVRQELRQMIDRL